MSARTHGPGLSGRPGPGAWVSEDWALRRLSGRGTLSIAGEAAVERLRFTPTPSLSPEETGDILGSGPLFPLPLYPECRFVS